MKTLHNIFHNKLFKSYAMILMGTVACLITGLLTTKMKGDSGFMSLLNSVAYLAAAVGPLATLFINNSFPHNIKFLINQHWNRAELLKFFFFSQTLKVLLGLVNYSVLGLVLFAAADDGKNIIGIPEFTFLFSDYFVYFIAILSGLYVFYFFALFGANRQDMQRVKAARSATKLNKKKQWTVVVAILTLLHVTANYTVPDALKGYLWCLFLAFTSFVVLNRAFKLVHQGKSYKLAGFGSFAVCIPLLAILYGMRMEAQNPRIDFKSRADSVVYLNWMNTEFSENEMLSFLKEVDDSSYNEILHLFGDKVEFNSSLALIDNEYRAKKFIDFHSRKYSEDKVMSVISHMSKLMIDHDLSFEFAQYSHSFLIKQKVDAAYIDQLIESESPYKQLASIYFAKNSFDKTKLLEFYKRNSALLDKAVVNDRYVKRSIASEEN